MAEDEHPTPQPEPAPPPEPDPASARAEAAETAPAPGTERADDPAVEAAADKPAPDPAAPTNKLHEWGAAVGIMIFLALVLWTFLTFLRSASI